MPNVPTLKQLKSTPDSVPNLLNYIRSNASSLYQERVPEATRDNISETGNAILAYQATKNEFLDALVNRIARVLVVTKMFQNPLKVFKKGLLEYGETVEEIQINFAKAHQFDSGKSETNFAKREIPDVGALFHKRNYQNYYKQTIEDRQLRAAFLSAQGVSDLIAGIVNSMYNGSEYDEFIIMKELIALAANKGQFYPITVPAPAADSAKEIVTAIKGASNMLEFPSTAYNSMGFVTFTKKPDQVLLIDAEFDATIDVNVLASAFNMSKAEFMGRRVLLDNFGSLTGVVAALVDKDWFMVFDNLVEFTEFFNGEGLYWNYWLHVWKTFSTSLFANAVLFTTESAAVTGVVITPASPTVPKGTKFQFTAKVNGTGYVPNTVVWSVSGGTASTIDSKGVLTVPKEETASNLTVTATSVFDGEKSNTTTVTLS